MSSGSWSVSASSVLAGLAAHVAAKALDGLTGDEWATYVSNGNQFDWLQVDFGSELTVRIVCSLTSTFSLAGFHKSAVVSTRLR